MRAQQGKQIYEAKNVMGLACDVTVSEQVQELWEQSVSQFGKVDIWVNNAGSSGKQGRVWELSAGE